MGSISIICQTYKQSVSLVYVYLHLGDIPGNIHLYLQTQSWNAVMNAAMNGHVGIIKKLIASGAKIDVKNEVSYTL